MVRNGFFSAPALSAVTDPLEGGEVTAATSCPYMKVEISMAIIATNNFRNIVMHFKC